MKSIVADMWKSPSAERSFTARKSKSKATRKSAAMLRSQERQPTFKKETGRHKQPLRRSPSRDAIAKNEKVNNIVKGILKTGTVEDRQLTLSQGLEDAAYRGGNVDITREDFNILSEHLRVRSTKHKISNKPKIEVVKAYVALVATISDGKAPHGLSTWG